MKTALFILLLFFTLSAKDGVPKVDFSRDSLFTCSLWISSSLHIQTLFNHFNSDETFLSLPGSADTVFIKKTDGSNRFISLFDSFGYKAKAVTIKESKPANFHIAYRVTSFEHNWKSVPKLLKGESRYQFRTTVSGTNILYTQRVQVDRKLGFMQRMLVKWQLKPLCKQIVSEIKQLEKR